MDCHKKKGCPLIYDFYFFYYALKLGNTDEDFEANLRKSINLRAWNYGLFGIKSDTRLSFDYSMLPPYPYFDDFAGTVTPSMLKRGYTQYINILTRVNFRRFENRGYEPKKLHIVDIMHPICQELHQDITKHLLENNGKYKEKTFSSFLLFTTLPKYAINTSYEELKSLNKKLDIWLKE